MPPYLLSESDRRLIQEFLDQRRKDRVNVPSRTRNYAVEQRIHQASDTYVALPRQAIPALVRGNPSFGEKDRPGSGLADIYEINTQGELVRVSTLSERVYNLEPTTIPVDWVPIFKDKYGRWLAVHFASSTATPEPQTPLKECTQRVVCDVICNPDATIYAVCYTDLTFFIPEDEECPFPCICTPCGQPTTTAPPIITTAPPPPITTTSLPLITTTGPPVPTTTAVPTTSTAPPTTTSTAPPPTQPPPTVPPPPPTPPPTTPPTQAPTSTTTGIPPTTSTAAPGVTTTTTSVPTTSTGPPPTTSTAPPPTQPPPTAPPPPPTPPPTFQPPTTTSSTAAPTQAPTTAAPVITTQPPPVITTQPPLITTQPPVPPPPPPVSQCGGCVGDAPSLTVTLSGLVTGPKENPGDADNVLCFACDQLNGSFVLPLDVDAISTIQCQWFMEDDTPGGPFWEWTVTISNTGEVMAVLHIPSIPGWCCPGTIACPFLFWRAGPTGQPFDCESLNQVLTFDEEGSEGYGALGCIGSPVVTIST